MGGKALPGIPTRRLSAAEFHALTAELPARLSARLGCRIEPITAYRTKPDFGDLDLLLDADALEQRFGEDWPRALDAAARELSHARKVVVNGSRRDGRFLIDTTAMSYDHRPSLAVDEGFQVDLILTRAATFDVAKGYYAYNDLGNLVGRVAHRLGFVYGHRGLLYPLRKSPTQLIAMVDVSRDTDACLSFLGYDASRFRQGFDTLEEVFAYAASSPYFHRSIYLLENRNHASRMRDRKRATYAGFLKAMTEHSEWLDRDVPPPDAIMERAFAAFPGFRQDLAAAAAPRVPVKNDLRTLFSGANVRAWTGLEGADVALLMERVRMAFPSRVDFSAYVQEAGEEGLKARVRAALEEGPLPSPRRRTP